ncbi:MAG: peptidylprolyl isomerase [Butyribacter sp.]|jgi:peptidyl-prolyl cis-trans isomerase B (cyclophilin B)|uniref:peptidylprolyl isomerase n=1 Tax=Butyribacter TaxID=2822463 RepID=UPI00033D43F2|nr:peptidylprolyl isomerase [Butyribacter intestini]MBS5364998.1 peptidylprolyl isomerase [Clostridium sp.]MCQ5166357.1 peptidylprolyl isomerase [Roseburia hominis]OKZ80517.1 MAG: peptidylprolyl isomerase [Clostridium sp. CAG:12237_41]CCZ40616.1 peptidyl-prolyl cis-trans isomerase [Clostridium sp. CAG:122]
MKRYFSIIAIMALVVCMFAGCGSKKSNTSSNANSGTSSSESAKQEETAVPESTESTDAGSDISSSDDTKQLSGKHHVVIKVKKYGNIKVELDADTAPISVTNFVNLAKKGFYDGLTFHRIIDGFMIQGGDPSGDGTGGSDETIKGEFSDNGVENNISHVRGTISMARSSENDSASSQFFIVQSDSTYLDGQYAGFGTVTSGMDIVDKICKDTPVTDSNGTVEKENQPVIEKITVKD